MKDKSDGSQDNGDSRNTKSSYATLDNNVSCASATEKSGSKVISMCIVPVKIKHGDNNKMVTTYAMLQAKYVYSIVALNFEGKSINKELLPGPDL